MAFVVNIIEDVFDLVNDVVDWVVDEIVQPVISGVNDVINYVLDNPIEAIAKIGLTVVSGGAYAWAIPLVDGAATLAKGGNLGDALKAAAISYAGAKVGTVASTYVGNVAGDYLGDSFGSQIVSAGITAGAKSAATAIVYGQDPLQAFATGGIQGALGATLGKIDDAMEGQFENLQDGVKDSIQAGVAGALGDGNISADTVGNIVSTYSGVGDFMTNFLTENTGISDAAANVITTAVTSSVSTALAGNPNMSGEAFFATMSEAGADALKKVIDKPVNDAIDKVSGAYSNTETAANALNTATTNAGTYADRYNTLVNELNGKIATQDELKQAYNTALDRYNNNQTEANANAVNAAAKEFNDFATALEIDYNDNYKTQIETAERNFNFWNDQIPDLESTYNDARDWMVTTSEDLADEMKPVMDAADRAVALTLNSNIDEEAYREMYGLSADETVYGHFLANQPNAVTLDPNLNANSTALGGDTYYEADTDTVYERVDGKWQKVDRQTAPSLNDYVKLTLGEDYSYDTSDGKFYVETPDGRQQVNPYVEANEVSTTYDAPSMADMRAGTRAVGFVDRITSDMSRILESAGYEAPEGGVVMLEHFKALRDAGYNINPFKDPGTGVVIDGTKDFDAIKEEIVMGQTVYDPEQFLMSQPVLYSGNTLTFDGTTPVNAEIRQIFRDAGYSDAEVEYYAPVGGMVDLEGGAPTPDLVDAMYEAEYYPPDYDTMMTIAANVYGKETGTDKFMRNTTGLTLRSLGDLAATMGYVSILTNKAGWTDIDPTNNAMSRFGEGLEKLGMAAHTDEYKQALSEFEADMSKRLGNAEGAWETVKAIGGSAVSNPGMFFSEYIMSEVIQEAPALLLSGGTITVAKAGLKATAKNMGEEAAAKLATKVGFGAGVASDVAEAYAGAAMGAYNEAYQVYLDTQVPIEMREGGLSREEAIRVLTPLAEQYATKQAEDMGALGAITMVALSGYGNALERKLFKNADEATQGVIDSFAGTTTEIWDVAKKEGISEFFEEAIPAGALEARLALLDPTRDASGEITAAGVFGLVSGAGTGGIISTGNELIKLTGNLGADFAQLSNSDVRDAVQNSNNPQALTNALANLGLTDTKSVAALGNQVMPDQFTDENEVRLAVANAVDDNTAEAVKLGGPELTFTPEQIDNIVDTYVGSSDTSLNFEDSIYDMVDKNYVNVQEVKAAAAAEGIDLTDDEAAKYVGAKDEEDALTEIRNELDPTFTTEAEARKFFTDLGFTPTDEQVSNFVGAVNESTQQQAIAEYIDPRQVTEAEAKKFFEDIGYNPTQEEINAYVGQGDENFEAGAPDRVESYVDPRQVTDAEARQFFADLGYTPTDQEIADFTAQVSETEQQTAISEYVDPRFVTLDEVQAIADQEGLTLTEALAATYLGQRDEASALEAAQGEFDPLATTFDEAKQFFESQGYTPTTEEIAQFVASATEEAQQSGVAEYVDPRQVTEAESKAFLEALGYTPTDEEVASFVGQLNDATYQSSQETAVGEYVDPRQVTAEEAKQFFEDLGYTPTEEQIAEFTAQVAETEQQTAISKYVDPRQVTMAEVQAIADEEGLTLTEALAATYIGQGEADNFQQQQLDAARAEYDPLATTLEEATQFFADTGYNATTEEIAEFVASKTEEAQTSAIGAYVDPRQVTAAEAEEFLSAIGYQPTQEEIDNFVGQVNDENYQVTQKAKIDEYVDPRFFDAGEVRAAYEELGLVDVTQEDVDRFVGQYDPTSEDYSGEGFEAYQREQLRQYMPAATFNVIKSVLGSPAVEDNPDTPEDESKEATGIYAEFEAGATRDEALDAAIKKVAEDLGTTKTDLLSELGLTEERLGSEIDALAEDIGGIEEDIGGIEEDITGIEEDIGGISNILGTPAVEDDPDTEEDESQDATGLFATIKAYEDAGIERDEALELAIGEVASALGTTEINLLDAIGTSKTDILGELETGLGALEESLGGDIDAIADIIGKPAQEVTQVDIDFVADVIAQNQVLDELQTAQYDVTGDGIVDINDQNLLTSALQGEDVTFADTSMFGPATGLYGVIGDVQQDVQSQIDQQTDTITDLVTDLNTQIDTESKRRNLSDLTQMLMSAEDLGGQRVSVRTPDPVRLNYLYDFSSIFANPSQASLFASPFGGTRAQPANAPRAPMGTGLMNTGPMGPMGMAAGFAEGGAVEETDELLRILGEMK